MQLSIATLEISEQNVDETFYQSLTKQKINSCKKLRVKHKIRNQDWMSRLLPLGVGEATSVTVRVTSESISDFPGKDSHFYKNSFL